MKEKESKKKETAKKNLAEASASGKKTVSKQKSKTDKLKQKTSDSSVTKAKQSDELGASEQYCKDKDCPIHGNLKARGRTFEGIVTSKFHKRIAIEFERMIYIRKYERYAKSKTKIHARLPICMEKEINVGDLIQIQECRPLSKIIHFVVVKKIKAKEEGK